MTIKEIKEIKPEYVLFGFLSLAGVELANILLLKMLGINATAYPWSFIQALDCGFFMPVLIAFLITAVPFVGIYLWIKGGVERVLGRYILIFWLGFILINWLADYLYILWEGLNIPASPWQVYTWFITIPKNTYSYSHLMICIFGCYVLLCIGIITKLPYKKSKAEKIFGSAHFANAFEIKKAGLFKEEGILLGKYQGKELRLSGFESVMVVSPTGGGKTTAAAIPNLFTWSGSGVFNDLKGELYRITAKYREKFLYNKCYHWQPASEQKRGERTARHNPFFYVSKNPELRIRDIQLIAEVIIPATKLGDAFWYQSSREIFLTLALYLFEEKGMATLAEIHDLSKQYPFTGWLRDTVIGQEKFSRALRQNAQAILSADEKTQGNILKDFHSRMNLFSDPLIRYATSGNDFDFRKLRKEKMSIYIEIPDSDKERLKPILTLFWAQLINAMCSKEPDIKEEPIPVLALMDEFGNMARIDRLKDGMSFMRAYRMRCIVIVQQLAQIYSTYGQYDAKGFLNSKVKIAYALNDLSDAKFFAESLGKKTVKTVSRSVHTESSSENISYRSRELMTADEIMQMNENDQLILLEAQSPIRAKKCYWFKDKKYKNLQEQL